MAFLYSLKVLRENVVTEIERIRTGSACSDVHEACDRLMAHLNADCKEVLADFDAVMDRGGEGW
jgi:hypothetical protein